jgi:hypothetical protein
MPVTNAKDMYGAAGSAALALLLLAAPASVSAEVRRASSTMEVTVEVVRPAAIEYQADASGQAGVRTSNAAAKVTTGRVTEGAAPDCPRTIFVTVEY